jgi:Leucine-rich repeat (LRR) protein
VSIPSKNLRPTTVSFRSCLQTLLIAALVGVSAADATIPATERAALQSIYVSTGGDTWFVKVGWNEPIGSECHWFGVACNADESHVIGIGLAENHLTGVLPETLHEFPMLKRFLAYKNRLTGSIAPLTRVASLEFIDVSNNLLTGSITGIESLRSLRALVIHNNQLSGSIPALPPISLAGARLCPNQLTKSSNPPWDAIVDTGHWDAQCTPPLTDQLLVFETVPVLKPTGTGGNVGTIKAVSLPTPGSTSDIAYTSLSARICSVSRTTGVITIMGGAVVGDTCTIAADKGSDDRFNTATQKQVPIVVSTELVPSEANALRLFYANASGVAWRNRNHWLDAAFHECDWYGVSCTPDRAHVTGLALSNNSLGSQLLDVLSAWPLLRDFDVSRNNLSGSLPTLALSPQLESFNASENRLSGAIPTLTTATKLRVFSVADNDIHGSIPSLAALSNLVAFLAGNNRLRGSIPALSGLTALANFDVSANVLTGTIPPLTNLPQLTRFNVSDNALTGSIPTLSNLSNLGRFEVQLNYLGGTLPSLNSVTKLRYVDVSFNNLVGAIPSLSALAELRFLFVNDNQFSGKLPTLPSPSELISAVVCPNRLTAVANATWDQLTFSTPWYKSCAATQAASVTVYPSVASAQGTISIDTAQIVSVGSTLSLLITPNVGFTIADVAGTCGGSLLGNTYTTNPLTIDCTVIVGFMPAVAADAGVAVPTLSRFALIWFTLFAAAFGALRARRSF